MPTLAGMKIAWFALAVIALVLLAVVSRYDYSMAQDPGQIGRHVAYDRWTGAVWSLLPTGEKYNGHQFIWFKTSGKTVRSLKREIEQRTDSLDQMIEREKREEE